MALPGKDGDGGSIAEVEAAIKEAHPYDVPEILAFEVAAGSADYLAWLSRELTTGQHVRRINEGTPLPEDAAEHVPQSQVRRAADGDVAARRTSAP